MGFVVDTTGQKVGSGSTRFAPIPEGDYEVTIYDAEFKTFKEGGVNAGRPGVNYQFRISDGQPRANSRLFQQVGIFAEWNPKKPGDEPKDNFTFFNFFATLLGKKNKEFRAEVAAAIKAAADAGTPEKTELPIPDPTSVLGKALVITIKNKPDTYAFGKYQEQVAAGTAEEDDLTQADFLRSEISAFKPAGSATAGAANAKSAADDGLITL